MNRIHEVFNAVVTTANEVKQTATDKVAGMTPEQKQMLKHGAIGAALGAAVVGGVVLYKRRNQK